MVDYCVKNTQKINKMCALQIWFISGSIVFSVTRKKSPNVYKSYPKIISQEKW